MSSNQQTREHGDPWRDEGQVFRAVGVIVLLIFGGFIFYDGRGFYERHIARCRQAPDQPECSFLNIPRPESRPELGIVLDQGSGKWALQLAAMDHETANRNLVRLGEAGATARLVKTSGRKKTIYYLQLGRFKTRKDALEAGEQLKARNLVTSYAISPFLTASN